MEDDGVSELLAGLAEAAGNFSLSLN